MSAIGADLALRQAIVGTLQAHCVPALTAAVQDELPAGLPEGGQAIHLLRMLPSVLQHASLAPARRQRTRGAVAEVEHAAALVRSLAAERPSGMSSEMHLALLERAVGLLGGCCQRVVLDTQAAGGTPPQAAAADAQAEQHAAGWLVAALLPQLKSSIAAVAGSLQLQQGSAEAEPWVNDLSTLFGDLVEPLDMMSGLELTASGPQQICTWLAAAAAGLQLLPLCTQLLEGAAAAQPGDVAAVLKCSICLTALFVDDLQQQARRLLTVLLQWCNSQQDLPPEEAAAWDSLPALLWALHTSLCRFTAALGPPNASLRLPGQHITPGLWRQLLSTLNTLLLVTVAAHRLSSWRRATSPPRWQLHSLLAVPQ